MNTDPPTVRRSRRPSARQVVVRPTSALVGVQATTRVANNRENTMNFTRTTFAALFVTSLVAVSGSALAGPKCTTAPKDKWMSEEAMKAKVAEMGFKVKTFKVTGPCYEIYGWNKEGKKAEVYFNPVDGSITKAEIGK
jgi:hypothetical protein